MMKIKSIFAIEGGINFTHILLRLAIRSKPSLGWVVDAYTFWSANFPILLGKYKDGL